MTEAGKPVDVIILNWNGARLLEEYLPQVVANSDNNISRIIVADNGSDDGSVDYLEKYFPTVKLIVFDRNYGFAEGYNRALAAVNSKYVVLLNSDVATTPGWDTELFDYMETHPDTGVCQPKILSYKDPAMFEYAGACGGFLDRNGYPYCRGRIISTCERDSGQYDEPLDNLMWASGAAFMVRRDLYVRCGGLDPKFFAHMEEIDLCWRVHLAGYRIVCLPESRVYHLGGATLAASDPRKTYLNFRNNLLMLHKNLPPEEGRRLLFVRRLYDTLAWLKFMLTAHFADANALLKAHNDFRKSRKRYTAHPQENLLTTFDEARRNITVDYFLRRKKKF